MFTINHRAAALAALAALFATGATAQVSGGGVGVDAGAGISFSSSDRNADGSISKDEASGMKDLSGRFDDLDANRDGKLDQGEFAKFEASGSASGKSSGKSDGTSGTKSKDKNENNKDRGDNTPEVQNLPGG